MDISNYYSILKMLFYNKPLNHKPDNIYKLQTKQQNKQVVMTNLKHAF